ncbi:MAG: hypothetical protein NWE96_03420 [Candidatus Bathyarchaeota archaeon]|nr:hypothetical protein [Candidatus Bathyarchaeota archaeon]
MRQHGWRLAVIVVVVLLAMLLVYCAAVQSTVSVSSTNLRVYRDGLVHVEQMVVVDEFSPQATVTLLSDDVENMVVLDADQLAVDYQLLGTNLVVYSLGATQLSIEYDTNTLTNKQNEIWTLLLSSPYSVNVTFPLNSTIIYMSSTPTAINTAGNQLSLCLGSGQWEISYILQLIAGGEDSLDPTDSSQPVGMIPLEYVVVVAAGLIIAIVVALLLLKRKRKPNIKKALNDNPHLMKEDRAVLEFLAEKEGKAFEAEIRERFPEIPRTSLWRLIKRLEKLEIVEVKKIGLENQVILKK